LVVQPELCVECDLCEVICPDFAIFCLPEEEEEQAEGAPETQTANAREEE
jgi:formate hydrogenlyase subunit 6/NADH:ubiquinone oxidoreductase subunit I